MRFCKLEHEYFLLGKLKARNLWRCRNDENRDRLCAVDGGACSSPRVVEFLGMSTMFVNWFVCTRSPTGFWKMPMDSKDARQDGRRPVSFQAVVPEQKRLKSAFMGD
jgi:hypothetical protein